MFRLDFGPSPQRSFHPFTSIVPGPGGVFAGKKWIRMGAKVVSTPPGNCQQYLVVLGLATTEYCTFCPWQTLIGPVITPRLPGFCFFWTRTGTVDVLVTYHQVLIVRLSPGSPPDQE